MDTRKLGQQHQNKHRASRVGFRRVVPFPKVPARNCPRRRVSNSYVPSMMPTVRPLQRRRIRHFETVGYDSIRTTPPADATKRHHT